MSKKEFVIKAFYAGGRFDKYSFSTYDEAVDFLHNLVTDLHLGCSDYVGCSYIHEVDL